VSVLSPYPTPDEREAMFERAARGAGAEIITLGASVEGRSIRAARVPASKPTERRVLLSANIHGVEVIGARTAIAFLERLSDPFPSLEQLRERAEIVVVPCINPDAYARTFEREGIGTLKELRTNAHGVDLNRNFPMPFGRRRAPIAFAGSDDPENAFYRGPEPLSEPEAAAMAKLFREAPFVASANLHSCMGTLIPARVTTSAEFDEYKRLCASFSAGQTGHRYRRLSSQRFDVFTGEQEDHQHHAHKTRAVCVEIFPIGATIRQHLVAPKLFWRFNPRDPDRWIANDLPGLAAYYLAALELC
jgi:predicted deacylase